MKNLKYLGLALLTLGAISCSSSKDDDPVKNPILQPIQEVIAKDGTAEVKAEIDHAARTIKLPSFVNTEDMSAVEVKFTIKEGAKLIKPAPISTLDFTKQPIEVVVNNAVRDLTYSMTAEKPVINPIKKAGFEPAEQFGNLPEHIKIFTNKKLGDGKDAQGFLVEVTKGAKFSMLGTGDYKNNGKSIADWAKIEKDWIIYMDGICGMKCATIKDSKILYSSGSVYPVFAVEKDGTFVVCPQKHQKDDKGNYVNFLEKLDNKAKLLKKDWMPETAMGGYYMVAADGKAMTDEEMKVTGMFNSWFQGDAPHGREFIGVNKDGDKAYFFVNGVKNGLSMRAVVDIMLQVGCHNVMTMEGASSANFLVRGQKGIEENDGAKVTSCVLVIK